MKRKKNNEAALKSAAHWQTESDKLFACTRLFTPTAIPDPEMREAAIALWCAASFASGYMQGEAERLRKVAAS